MALKKKGKYWYGDTLDDVRTEMLRYSKLNTYLAERFAGSTCACGGQVFKLESDDEAGAARRTCTGCGNVHLMGDSADYADEADFDNHTCVCDAEAFALLTGVALYAGSEDVRWVYIGCRCVACGLVGVFADWKCEAGDAGEFLAAA